MTTSTHHMKHSNHDNSVSPN